MSTPTFVVVPGLRGSAPSHWQELFAARTGGAVTVPFPEESLRHSIEERTRLLGETVAAIEGPVILVAHSAGVLATVHWIRSLADGASALDKVVGALLATPPDFGVHWPEPHPRPAELSAAGWEPIPRRRLPFPSIVAASRSDPLARYRTTAGLAEAWGSRLVDLGDAGHLNPASGYGEWPLLDELLAELAVRAPSETAP
ncbi:RBBP9/YdeN family alpha/beta hydrolase [Tsukamurella pseudospumae]|uniref:Alpha/beta hydrolase n=1 Tax=Tsukamurella pseudospumae TaxID=239498 RepID=A0A137ZTU5_9ACTN|nr:alpha/beta hydrolase [Tsukamurella pseudospumae]KXP01589.1 alpha/beta hydrolase [Tsukamurella pseudospumae]